MTSIFIKDSIETPVPKNLMTTEWFQRKIYQDEENKPKYKKRLLFLKNTFWQDEFEEIIVEKENAKKKEACRKALERFLVSDIARIISEKVTVQKISTPLLEEEVEPWPVVWSEGYAFGGSCLFLGILSRREIDDKDYKSFGNLYYAGKKFYYYRLRKPVTKKICLGKYKEISSGFPICKHFYSKTKEFEYNSAVYLRDASQRTDSFVKTEKGNVCYYSLPVMTTEDD